jgi:hypothetical protein
MNDASYFRGVSEHIIRLADLELHPATKYGYGKHI